MPVPGYSRCDATRVSRNYPVAPPHELLHLELSESSEATTLLQDALAKGTLPRSYTTHPAVQRAPAGALVHPL
eukprot:14296278-Alexandrium_andersonii.AAC.1